MLKKTLVASAIAAALGSGFAAAQTPPASPHTFSGNIGLYSQYIFRGLTQTDGDPAVQGALDYGHSSGLYAGVWGSNISWTRENNFGAPGTYRKEGHVEVDLYGGWKWGFAPDWTLDLGTLYYWYPGEVYPGFTRADAWELYAGVSWKWLSAKYSYAVRDKNFQFANSDGSWYLDLSLNFPLEEMMKELKGFTVSAHWGKQDFRGSTAGFPNDTCSYEDWKVGISYALPKNFTVGAFYTDTSGASNLCYGNFLQGGPYYNKNIAKGTGTIYVMWSF